jgi:hypothetical protein
MRKTPLGRNSPGNRYATSRDWVEGLTVSTVLLPLGTQMEGACDSLESGETAFPTAADHPTDDTLAKGVEAAFDAMTKLLAEQVSHPGPTTANAGKGKGGKVGWISSCPFWMMDVEHDAPWSHGVEQLADPSPI